jgi:hypothetical protein
MESLKALGKKDIFGIILPGTILVLISAYGFWGIFELLHLPVGDLLKYEFLLTIILFVTAYLIGSLLRLFAADDIDKESSKYALNDWGKNDPGKAKTNTEKFNEIKAELAKGEIIKEVPAGFDDWIWREEDFPYPVWMNRFWSSNGFNDVLDFYRKKHKDSMWSINNSSPKSFFNYCKLRLVSKDEALSDEVNAAESLTRFFAGTVSASRLSIRVLDFVLVVQILSIAIFVLGPGWGLNLPIALDWQFQIFYLLLTLVLIFVLNRCCRLIVKMFRHVRLKEAETVYHAFFISSERNPVFNKNP